MVARIARWWLLLIGGILLGAGMELHGLVAIAHRMVDEVDQTFPLFVAIGRATIFLLGNDQRIALMLKDVPPDVLDECTRSGFILMTVGGLFAVTAPILRGPRQTKPN
ncbi:hypothetical protein LBMAG49_28260 [Planctomycetota bacterium]|nr:hypothetical protein [Planctomycetota bacterium]MSR39454.1 hypothetical protein [Planctomycetota bacterium]GDY03497.1 hypothetical protein LBMAG49_28260 [Planctomycetota bacterium]